jgi:putative transposase
MAGRDSMTVEEVVRRVLRDEHADVIRESVRAVAREIMEAEVAELIGAEHGERRPDDRATHRNGYRARRWDTRAGEIELQIPKLRQGSYFPSFLQPRKRSEQALVSVVQQAYVCGVSTRRVDQLVESLGLRISKSEVSRIAGLLDEQVQAFRSRPLEGRYPYLFVDAKVEKVRDGGRVARKCVVIAHAVHETGRREIIGLDVGEAETEAFWREFLRGLIERGLIGVQLAISDAHPGLKSALAQVLGAPWQRCTVHFLRDCLGHARKDQHGLLAALIRPIFRAQDGEEARRRLGEAVGQLQRPLRKVAAMLEEAEEDILAFYAFPAEHWPKLRSTNPLERFNREIGRRTDVVGIFPDDASLIRLVSMLAIEANDEWLVSRGSSACNRWSLSSSSQFKRTRERRFSSSKRPETPSASPTRQAPRSHTTCWDLTRSEPSKRSQPPPPATFRL